MDPYHAPFFLPSINIIPIMSTNKPGLAIYLLNNNEFNSKNLSNYFSAIVSYDNQKNVDSLKFFKSSKSLINRHDPFLKKYIFVHFFKKILFL